MSQVVFCSCDKPVAHTIEPALCTLCGFYQMTSDQKEILRLHSENIALREENVQLNTRLEKIAKRVYKKNGKLVKALNEAISGCEMLYERSLDTVEREIIRHRIDKMKALSAHAGQGERKV